MRIPLLVFLVVILSVTPLFSQVNEFGLVPVSLHTYPCSDTGTVEVDVTIKIVNDIRDFVVPVLVSGTSNPVLDTVLTGGLADLDPPGFDPPSLVSGFCFRIVNPYPTAPGDPMLFVAINEAGAECLEPLYAPQSGLYCRTYWKVSGPGTMIWVAANHSRAGGPQMVDNSGHQVAVNWDAGDTVGVFNIVGGIEQAPVVNCPSNVESYTNSVSPINIQATDPGGSPLKGIFLQGALPCGSGAFGGSAGEWTYTWDTRGCTEGTFDLTFGVFDECETTYCSVQDKLTFVAGFVKIGCVSGDPCGLVEVPVLLNPNLDFGAFDLYVDFDPSVLYFKGVEKGAGLPAGWELFTYRQLPCPLCGCCKYKLQLLGLYDIKDLHQGEPIPMSTDYIELAVLKFQIACDENLRGYNINICFEFDDGTCKENTFSDVTGNVLYVSDNPAFFDYADCDTQYHEWQGGSNVVMNKMHFNLYASQCTENPLGRPCGGIHIGTSGQARGDVNWNDIAYEVGDLTLFSSYFIYGTSVFKINVAGQTAATDINANGRPLELSDFITMIRVMTGDATPIPRPTPGSDLATIYATSNGSETWISTNATLGAALFIFKGAARINSGLKMTHGMVNGMTRVFVYMGSGTGITGELFTVEGELVSVQAVDNFGRDLNTTLVRQMISQAFALYPNYPNPFNPTTNISFALPVDSRVSLKIYNVAGQLVRTLVNEAMPAGNHTVTWDGANSRGDKVASGIYFYKLSAGDFSQTMKMVVTR